MLRATLGNFAFENGRRRFSCPPVLFITEEKRIAAIGEIPEDATALKGIDIFETESEDTFLFLEGFLRYGFKRVMGPVQVIPPVLTVSIDSGIQARLKGFAIGIFRHACLEAGAAEVQVQREAQPIVGDNAIYAPGKER